jgi:single-strand DNA-binding protein
MAMSKVQIIGNVGGDPEARYTQTGTKTVRFNVAVNNRRRNQDGSFQEETEWYRVTAFNRLAEFCEQYVSKGMRVYVDGRLRLDRWTGQDNTQRYTLEIMANDVQFMESRPRGDDFEHGAPAQAPSRASSAPSAMEPSDLEDLPF